MRRRRLRLPPSSPWWRWWSWPAVTTGTRPRPAARRQRTAGARAGRARHRHRWRRHRDHGGRGAWPATRRRRRRPVVWATAGWCSRGRRPCSIGPCSQPPGAFDHRRGDPAAPGPGRRARAAGRRHLRPPRRHHGRPGHRGDDQRRWAHLRAPGYALGIAGDVRPGDRPGPCPAPGPRRGGHRLRPVREDALGEEQPYRAGAAAVVRAVPGEPETSPDGIEPQVVDWPAAAPVRLSDAGDCAEVRPRRWRTSSPAPTSRWFVDALV